MTKGLDRIDLKILAVLAEEGRISWNELGDRVGLSHTPALRRVRMLEEAGYIAGYGVRLDEARLGLPINVFVSVTLESQRKDALAAFEERVMQMPEVMSCFMMTGGADYLLRVLVPDIEAYKNFVAESLSPVPGVSRLNSSIAIKPVLQRSAPPLGALSA